ncbi:MAG: hypothetical protein Fur0035_06690 [Anaerolineales bacterium]
MPLRDLFPFRNNPQSRFDPWPPAPAVRPIWAGKAEGFPSAFPDSSPASELTQRLPTLVLALGSTGEEALRLWLEKLSDLPPVACENVRATLITERQDADLPATPLSVRVIELQQGSMLNLPRSVSGADCRRAGPALLFQQRVNASRLRDWLQETLLDLGDGVQVFVLGSLAEPIIGVLGEVLQMLRLLPASMARKNPFVRVSALFSLSAQGLKTPPLPSEEVFAAFREVGRFTFNGPHRMNNDLNIGIMVRSALLDHLFLLESPVNFQNNQPVLTVNIPQALAETLFTLIHPSARFLWENLINDLRLAGQVRQETHLPVVHGVGIATLYVPLQPIKKYLAARLANAALFGEQKDEDEGFLSCRAASAEIPPLTRAARLLRAGASSAPHPLFDWLLNLNGPASLSVVPLLGPEYISAFQSQLANGLVQTLNSAPANLQELAETLAALDQHLEKVAVWFADARPADPRHPSRALFASLLPRWRQTTQTLLNNLLAWKNALQAPAPAAAASAPAAVPASWRSATGSWRREDVSVAVARPETVAQAFSQWRSEAENTLTRAPGDKVYRSVISETPGDTRELEKYYTESIRPELHTYLNQPSLAFRRVRERLQWWIRLSPNREPEIYLLCWPLGADTTTGQPPDQGTFRADQAMELAQALFHLAGLQAGQAEADLTGSWFVNRIHALAREISVEETYLAYDHQLLSPAEQRRSYLISHDPTLSRAVMKDVFPQISRLNINELAGGDADRFTALTLRLNMPSTAILTLREAQTAYGEKLPETLHLYPQEAKAAIYERYARRNYGLSFSFAADLLPVFSDPQAAPIFCKAWLYGLIDLFQEDGALPVWQVCALRNDFAPLPLAPEGRNALLQAFLRFTVELPFAPDVELNPQNHFHSLRREAYFRAILAEINQRALQLETEPLLARRKAEVEAWRQQVSGWKNPQVDLLLQSFALVLNAEYNQPTLKSL